MSPISKDGEAPVDKFWIVRPSRQRKNHSPKLFWSREGVIKHFEREEKSRKKLQLPEIVVEVFYVDLGRKRIERVK